MLTEILLYILLSHLGGAVCMWMFLSTPGASNPISNYQKFIYSLFWQATMVEIHKNAIISEQISKKKN